MVCSHRYGYHHQPSRVGLVCRMHLSEAVATVPQSTASELHSLAYYTVLSVIRPVWESE